MGLLRWKVPTLVLLAIPLMAAAGWALGKLT